MDFLLPFHTYQQKYRQKYMAFYFALRDSIVEGNISLGTKLPSSREMAQLYSVSRGTINTAYEMLAAEGYLISEVGKGTFVAFEGSKLLGKQKTESTLTLSDWGKRVGSLGLIPFSNLQQSRISFELGVPDLALFPIKEWNRHLFTQVRRLTEHVSLDVYKTQGYYPLRAAIAQYLKRTRGIETSPDEIVIVNGSMQGIALLIHLLVNPGESVVVENPGYSGTHKAIMAAGGKPLPGGIDSEGIVLQHWDAGLLVVTPSRQFPTGAVLSLERRQALLKWADERQALIIEDDYDSEFRYRGKPIEPLKMLDQNKRVVYIGTFSKTMLSHLRIGYIVLPPTLVDPFVKAKQLFEPHATSMLQQRALASFMNSGGYERHLRRMKRTYSHKYALLYTLFNKHLKDLFRPVASNAGLHLFAWWKHSMEDYQTFKEACLNVGLRWSDTADYFADHPVPSACFGFSHLSEGDIKEGVLLMKQMFSRSFS